MIIPPDHVRDLQQAVIYDDGKIIRRHSVRSHQDEIIQFGIVKADLSVDEVVNDGHPGISHPEAKRPGSSRLHPPIPTSAVIVRGAPRREGRSAALLELLGGTDASIGPP